MSEKKKQVTIYQSKEDIRKLNEIYAYRLLLKKNAVKSTIYSEALSLLYDKEYHESRKNNE